MQMGKKKVEEVGSKEKRIGTTGDIEAKREGAKERKKIANPQGNRI